MAEFSRGQDLTGLPPFGELTVLRRATPEEARGRGYYFWCRCACGREKAVYGGSLRSGATQTCGHKRAAYFRRHGQSSLPEHAVWQSMIQRCHNPRSQRYGRYGARGISVCARWRESFENFLADVGRRPSPDHSIERKDNDGNYEPGNCRWATRQEQARNTSVNRRVEHAGRILTVTEWAAETGLMATTITSRLDSGWPVEAALTVPAGGGVALRLRDARRRFLPNRSRTWKLDGSGHGYHVRPEKQA